MFTKKLIGLLLLVTLSVLSYAQKAAPENWFNLDRKKDKIFGMSTEKAHQYLAGKTSQVVIVGVLDSGVDEDHEDLKAVMWVNTKEVANNGVDDDNNGYIDDIYGWNFI